MRKVILGLALALGVLASPAQQGDCTQRIRELAAESEQVLPIDIAGIATVKSLNWDEEAVTLTLDMGFATSFNSKEARERVYAMRPKMLAIYLNIPQMADILRCLADEDGKFCLDLYDADGGIFPKYIFEYDRGEILKALEEQPTSQEEYNARYMQDLVASCSVGLPSQIDEGFTLNSVSLEDKYLVYDFSFADTEDGRKAVEVLKKYPAESKAMLAEEMSEKGELVIFFPVAKKGYGVRQRYRVEGQTNAVDVDFTPEHLLELMMGGR